MSAGSKRVQRKLARKAVATTEQQLVATKAVGYIRVSTEEQAEHGHGLEAQHRAIEAFAVSQGYELVGVSSDPGVSGASRPADREGFNRALALAAARAFSVLLVYKFDRLARDIRHAVTTVAELGEQHGVVLRSVTEPIDTSSPMGRTVFAILAGMAEAERGAITERTTSGRLTKATKGGIACGTAPYGYERTPDGDLQVVSQEAAVVRKIFRWRSERLTLQAIAARLNGDMVPSPSGSIWRPGTVSYILDNPKYEGKLEWLFGDQHIVTEGAHQAIV